MEHCSVLIAGAGPAGAMAAKYAGTGGRVLVVDKDDLSDPAREKCCGGLLNEKAQETISALGLAVPGGVLASPQVFVIRAIDLDNRMERYYPKHYINIRRGAFDRYLRKEAEKNAAVEFAEKTTLVDFTVRPDGVEAVLRSENGKCTTVQADYLVGADGAGSMVRRTLEEKLAGPDEPQYPIRSYVALQRRYKAKEELPYHIALFDQNVTDYYSWVIPKDGELLCGSALPADKEARSRFGKFIAQLEKAGVPLGEPVGEQGCRMFRPYGPESVHTGAGRVFLAGEAAGFVSPSSEEGISYALRSGSRLGKALAAAASPDEAAGKYRLSMAKEIAGMAVRHIKGKIMYGPTLRGLVFKTGALSIRREP